MIGRERSQNSEVRIEANDRLHVFEHVRGSRQRRVSAQRNLDRWREPGKVIDEVIGIPGRHALRQLLDQKAVSERLFTSAIR